MATCSRNIKWNCPKSLSFLNDITLIKGVSIIPYFEENNEYYFLLKKQKYYSFYSVIFNKRSNRNIEAVFKMLNKKMPLIGNFNIKNISHVFISGIKGPHHVYIFLKIANEQNTIKYLTMNANELLHTPKISRTVTINGFFKNFTQKFNSTFRKKSSRMKKSGQRIQLPRSQCSKDAKMYHLICDRVWDLNCSQLTTKEEINTAIKDIKLCKYLRERHGDICFGGKQDRGHQGAISKMGKKLDFCQIAEKKAITVTKDETNLFEKVTKIARERDAEIKIRILKSGVAVIFIPSGKNDDPIVSKGKNANIALEKLADKLKVIA